MERVFNQCEAALWLFVGIGFLVKCCRARPPLRRTYLILAAAFLAFSASDLIEAETGSWWDPPWLLVLKVACVAAMVWGFRRYSRLKAIRNRGCVPQATGYGGGRHAGRRGRGFPRR